LQERGEFLDRPGEFLARVVSFLPVRLGLFYPDTHAFAIITIIHPCSPTIMSDASDRATNTDFSDTSDSDTSDSESSNESLPHISELDSFDDSPVDPVIKRARERRKTATHYYLRNLKLCRENRREAMAK
jgi:hypothetical protein